MNIKGSFALDNDDDDKVDFNKSPGIGCMGVFALGDNHKINCNHLVVNGCCTYLDNDKFENSVVAMGRPSFCTFSAAFVYIFRYLLKCHLLQIFNKILENWLYLVLDVSKYVKKFKIFPLKSDNNDDYGIFTRT